MPNIAIEIHDSGLTGIRAEGSDVVLDLDAYIHVSDGKPGVDSGTGWMRPVRITVRDAVVQRDFDGEVMWITDGVVRIDEHVFDNMIPFRSMRPESSRSNSWARRVG
jgi:hypothetical protein